jgi:flagellar biogenesis protein FliO
MPTISTLEWVVMVLVLMLAALAIVMVLAYMASRLGQSLRIDLDAARLLRIKISVQNDDRSRSGTRPSVPDDDPHSSSDE